MPFTFVCEQCGETFVCRASKPRIYCSKQCQGVAERLVSYEPRVCQGCNITFEPGASGRNAARTFCTRECYEANRANTVTKNCPVCGQDFTIKACIADRYTTCSNACKTAETVYVDCERCGKRFRSDRRWTSRFCSEECRRPAAMVTCRNCDAEFRVVPSEAASRLFCSRRCYRSFSGETRLEARVRVALTILGIRFQQEHAIGRWLIDFLLPDLGVALEADGDYWHSLTVKRDALRDAELERASLRVVRLAERDMNDAPDLGRLITERLEQVTGFKLASLPPAGDRHEQVLIGGGDRPSFRFNHRHAARVRGGRRSPDGTLPLWGSD